MIEKAKPTDFSEILNIVLECKSAQFAWDEIKLKQEFLANTTYVKKEDSRIICFVVVADRGDIAEWTVLATLAQERGRGAMLGLLKWVINALSHKRFIWLEVHELNNLAIKLYSSLGFKEVGRRERYYSDQQSAILMSKQLGS